MDIATMFAVSFLGVFVGSFLGVMMAKFLFNITKAEELKWRKMEQIKKLFEDMPEDERRAYVEFYNDFKKVNEDT